MATPSPRCHKIKNFQIRVLRTHQTEQGFIYERTVICRQARWYKKRQMRRPIHGNIHFCRNRPHQVLEGTRIIFQFAQLHLGLDHRTLAPCPAFVCCACHTLQMRQQGHVIFGNGNGLGQVAVFVVYVFNAIDQRQFCSLISLSLGLSRLEGHLSPQIQFSKPRKGLSKAEFVFLRPHAGFNLPDVVCIGKPRVRERPGKA